MCLFVKKNTQSLTVSLFTRERIEIGVCSKAGLGHLWSPSLRGSGLKSYLDTMAKTQGVSLLQKNELTETSIVF